MFVFDLETFNVQEFAEAYAAGLYDVNRLQDRWDTDSTPDEIVTEEDTFIVFEGCYAKPVVTMLKYISEIYEGDEMTYFDKDWDETVSSYSLFLIAHIASEFLFGLY